MALILSLETSTRVCSVALHKNGSLLALSEMLVEKSHSRIITLFIERMLQDSGYAYKDLDAVAVSKGPGSYTGLRIGVSTAKGLCFATDKPLIAVNTLQAMASGVGKLISGDALLCPMIDARRMEVYTALLDAGLNFVEETNAKIIDEHSFADTLSKAKIFFFGDGSGKCASLLQHSPNAVIIRDIYPSAKQVGILAEQQFNKGQWENTAYFEPYYLKDFVSNTH